MADYKLSYTAEEVDELLGKVKSGVCLPVVVDFDELGITNNVLQLFNAGGGKVEITTDNLVKKICHAIPLDRLYCAKLTVPDMGVMYVNPVYTLKNNGKLKSSHLDSYITVSGTITKFYVKINAHLLDGEYVGVDVVVGFH